MFIRTLSWTLLVGFLAAVSAPRAAAEPLKADPADTPLVIRGVIAPGGSTFVGNVRLTAPGKDATLRLLASDLKLDTDPTVVIDRAKVTINAGVKLAKDEPQDVRVSVGPVTRAGVYTGTLRFHADGIPVAEEAVVALRLEVHPTVAVKAIPETVSVATARAGLGDALLPDRLTRDSFVVVLDNPATEGVPVKDIDVYLRGENTNHVLGSSDFQWAEVKDLPAGKATHLVLTFPRSKLSADQYKGRVRVRLDGSDAPVSVPLDLSARVGPCWPIAVVLFGILMGRIARILSTPGAQMQLELFPRLVFLRSKAAGIANAAARAGVEAALDAVGERIERATETKDAIAQTMDQLSQQINQLLNPAAVGMAAPAPPSQWVVGLTAVLAFLTGVQPTSARFRFTVLQPIVSVVLLVALVILGLQTLYFSAGTTFGVNGLYDYFGLFVWGVSSEVAQRTLLQIGPKA